MKTASIHRVSQAVFAKIIHIHLSSNSTVRGNDCSGGSSERERERESERKKMRSATIRRKEVWDFVQLTFNLGAINWRWRTSKKGGGM